MSPARLRIPLPSAEATARLGAWLAPRLGPGDTLLLAGPIGAGKTHLARALIQTRLAAAGQAEDVPSPSFTLVQTYDAAGTEIWHADLYRLADSAEIAELGLEDAYDTAICLVEWPDRLGPSAPADALRIELAMTADGLARTADLQGPARWAPLLQTLAGEPALA
jgi:tRNA threonylcarbamoyladenosine biosynthesis protein TsaE